ncbi:MAG: winged helix-turn-helix domain-containing protein [Thermomicrobiales bacterium]
MDDEYEAMMTSIRPEHVQVITDPEALAALSHPLRLRILEYLRAAGGESRSVKEVAAALDVSQTKLYYHVHQLAEQELIRVAETRLVSGIVERRYQVTAYRLSVDRGLLASPEAASEALDVMLSVILDETRSEIWRSVDAGLIDLQESAHYEIKPNRLVLGRKWLVLTPEQVEQFRERFQSLHDEFAAVDESNIEPPPGAALYEMLVGFFPALPPSESPDAPRARTWQDDPTENRGDSN